MSEFQEIVDDLMKRQAWSEARDLLLQEREGAEDSHWLLTRIAETFYEELNYERALSYNRRALSLAPRCPLVLWNLAGTLEMLGYVDDAIDIWTSLLDRGVEEVATGECGEGRRWAESLLNDCRYRIARSAEERGKLDIAVTFYQSHLAHRQRGRPSLYPLSAVRARLAKLNRSE